MWLRWVQAARWQLESGGSGDGGTVEQACREESRAPGAAMVSSCQIFPPDNPWNVAIDGASVQVIHTYDSELPQGTELHADWGDFSTNGYGIPYEVVLSTQANLDVTFNSYASESDPGPGGWIGGDPVDSGSDMGETQYPFFVGMHIEGNPAAGGTAGNLPGDQHGLVLQQGANGSGCTAYEAWNCVVVSGAPFPCANGAVFDLASNALETARMDVITPMRRGCRSWRGS